MKRLPTTGFSLTRRTEGCGAVTWLGLAAAISLLCLAPAAQAIILYSTGDPTYNTTPPGGALTNSGWQYQGSWGAYLGTPIAPKYFITASHVGGAVGNKFHFRGVDYTTTAFAKDPNSDLIIWRICGTFPDFAQVYANSDEVTKPIVLFGRGTQRGGEIIVTNNLLLASLKGWF